MLHCYIKRIITLIMSVLPYVDSPECYIILHNATFFLFCHTFHPKSCT